MDKQTKSAILAITIIIPISSFYVWDSDQSLVLASTDSSEIQVLASFYPLYEFAKQVGQDKIDVSMLVPPGIEPHDWEPTISELQRMHNADLIVINGIGFENWIHDLDTVNSDIIIVDTSKEISVMDYDEHEVILEHDEHSSVDPHVWLNPIMAKIQVQNIADALVSIDPQNEKFYRQNAKSYQEKLDSLDSKIKLELVSCNKDFISFHNAFSYFAKQYGLNQHSIISFNEPSIGPSPKTLETVINFAKKYNVHVIFSEELIDPRPAQIIANEINGKILVLSPIEVIDENSDYILRMEKNLSNLKEALCN